LISRIYRELPQLNNKETNNQAQKWAKDLHRHLPREDIEMAKKLMKRCSTLLIAGEMQITTTGHHGTLIGMDSIKKKKTENIKCWQRCGRIGTLSTVLGNAKWCSWCDNSMH